MLGSTRYVDFDTTKAVYPTVNDIREQCQRAGVAFFFKQWGGVFKSRTGRELDGRTWDEMPDAPRASWRLQPVEQRA